jgi:hypothetical protein
MKEGTDLKMETQRFRVTIEVELDARLPDLAVMRVNKILPCIENALRYANGSVKEVR